MKTNINKQALTYGVIIGIISIVLTTIENMFLIDQFIAFYAVKVIAFILVIILMGVFTGIIRKNMGGYMEFKDAFRAIFIMILISELLYFIYTIIYYKFIDPDMLSRVKEATLSFMERAKTPQDKLDETADKFDEQIAEANKGFQFGKLALNYFSFVVLDSVFGLIVAAIVKKNKPVLEG